MDFARDGSCIELRHSDHDEYAALFAQHIHVERYLNVGFMINHKINHTKISSSVKHSYNFAQILAPASIKNKSCVSAAKQPTTTNIPASIIGVRPRPITKSLRK